MCGRFCFIKEAKALEHRYEIKTPSLFKPQYNASPGNFHPVISNENDEILQYYRWGLIPYFSKDGSYANNLINARIESIDNKKSFCTIFNSKRCIIPVTGFYEWDFQKQPHLICFSDFKIFSIAGLWDEWKSQSGEIVKTFTIITMPSKGIVSNIHSRMPVLINRDDERNWLSCNLSKEDMIENVKSDGLTAFQVSTEINSTKNDYPELIQKVGSQLKLF